MVTDENTTAVIREEGERCQISIEYFITVFPPDGSVKFSYIKKKRRQRPGMGFTIRLCVVIRNVNTPDVGYQLSQVVFLWR